MQVANAVQFSLQSGVIGRVKLFAARFNGVMGGCAIPDILPVEIRERHQRCGVLTGDWRQ